jgi:hypothetical protein
VCHGSFCPNPSQKIQMLGNMLPEQYPDMRLAMREISLLRLSLIRT